MLLRYVSVQRKRKLEQPDTRLLFKEACEILQRLIPKETDRLTQLQRTTLRDVGHDLSATGDRLNRLDITQIMCVLARIKGADSDANPLFWAISDRLDQNLHLDAIAITKMFTALQCTKDYGPVKRYMASFARKLENDGPNPLSISQFSAALYGFRNMNSVSTEVQSLIKSLVKMGSYLDGFEDSLQLLHAFRGISNFSSDAKEVQLLLMILAQKLQRTTVPIEPYALATGLYGLRSMKADNMATKVLLGSLVTKIRESTACFGPREITAMISPCRSLGDDPATFELMRAIAYLIPLNAGTLWKGTRVAMALIPLTHFSDSRAEVSQLTRAILKQSINPNRFYQIDIVYSLTSIANKTDLVTGEMGKLLVDALKIENMEFECLRTFAVFHSNLRCAGSALLTGDAGIKFRSVMDRWVEVSSRSNLRPPRGQFESEVQYILRRNHVDVFDQCRANFIHISGYEMDFYFDEGKVNIELDGDHHRLFPEKDSLRDKVLADVFSVTTIRISNASPDEAALTIASIGRKSLET